MIDRAVRALGEGKLVAFPTETVYGIAADAAQEAAVARLLQIKGRRPGQPLTLAVKSAAAAFDFCPDVSPLGRRLGRRCWPGPLTLVLSGSHPEGHLRRLAPPVRQAVAPADFVGLRVPDHRFLLETLQRLPSPLTLTSANRSGQADAVSAEEVVEALGDDVDLVLSDGRSPHTRRWAGYFAAQAHPWFIQGMQWRIIGGWIFAAGFVLLVWDLLTIGRRETRAAVPPAAVD